MAPTLALGVFLALCGGASIALSMVTQRYALSYPEPRVPLLGRAWPRNVVWVFGLLLYGVANAFYVMALQYGPLSLLAGVFTTLLVFNLAFARLLIGERLTRPKIAGACTILVGVCCTIASAPTGVPTEFTPKDVVELASAPVGAVYLVCLFGAVVASVVAINLFERRFPTDHMLAAAAGKTIADDGQPLRLAPRWLERVMGLVYPGSLGLDEGICHLLMKAAVSMLDQCGSGNASCNHWILYAATTVWILASIATLWWLRIVFQRYETTLALPIEYGAVNAASACSGLLFYQEYEYMNTRQITLVVVGCAIILLGIQVGRQIPAEEIEAEREQRLADSGLITKPAAEETKADNDLVSPLESDL